MNKMLSLVILSVTVVFLGAGCEKETASNQPSPVQVEPRTNNHVIAVIPKLTNTVFWKSVLAGAQEAGKDFGYKIVWNGPDRETNSTRQIEIVEDAITQQVAGVLLAPVGREALVPSVEKMEALNIPCFIIDSGLDTPKHLGIISTDNYQAGVVAAKEMGRILGGKGNIIVVRHILGSHAATKRVNGFCETITNEFPGIKIVDSQSGQDNAATAKQVTEEMLQRNPDVQGLFACNVDTSVGALQGLQALKRSNVKMVAFDPDKTLLDGLRTGQVDAIILQNPYQMGYEGVKALALHIKGEASARVIDTGIEVVTLDSLTEPKILRMLGEQQ